MKDLEEVRGFFSGDLYATEVTGIVIEDAHTGYAKVSLNIEKKHKNALGHVMGAVYFTMVDFAFAVASNYGLEEMASVTHSSQINFVGVPKTDTIYATACVENEGNRTNLYNIKVTDSEEHVIAVALSNGYKVKKK